MSQYITVGQIYQKLSNVPLLNKPYHHIERYDKVLSVTLTHVYIQNMRTGYTRNVDMKSFKKEWVLVESQEKHIL